MPHFQSARFIKHSADMRHRSLWLRYHCSRASNHAIYHVCLVTLPCSNSRLLIPRLSDKKKKCTKPTINETIMACGRPVCPWQWCGKTYTSVSSQMFRFSVLNPWYNRDIKTFVSVKYLLWNFASGSECNSATVRALNGCHALPGLNFRPPASASTPHQQRSTCDGHFLITVSFARDGQQ